MASTPLRNPGGEPIAYAGEARVAAAVARPAASSFVSGAHVPCCCVNCRRQSPPTLWPRHYVGIPPRADRTRPASGLWISYECHADHQGVDPELQDELNGLRNDAARTGAFLTAGRTGRKPR